MTMMNKRAMALVAAGLLLPALAGCSRSEPEDPPVPVETNDAGVTENMAMDETPVTTNAAEAAPVTNIADAAPPPPPERSQDQQMLDDASATGMTARVQRAPSDAPTADVEPKDGQ